MSLSALDFSIAKLRGMVPEVIFNVVYDSNFLDAAHSLNHKRARC
jgi:hypothetical protein